MNRLFGSALLFGSLALRMRRRRGTASLAERLAALPRGGWPLAAPVVVHWNDHQVPFIRAEHDGDLAVALGAVHAHLRLGQMEMMRRLAQGRLAEMIGPLGVGIDRLVRTLDPARAVPAIERDLPAETRRWLEGFARGVSHYLLSVKDLPEEFALFGLERTPWDVRDVLTLGRLVSADVSWIVWFQLLRWRNSPEWPALWRRLLDHDLRSPSGFDRAEALGSILRSGSNSFVVAGTKTATGAPLIGSDPHLSLVLPSPWLVAAMMSPSYHAVGLMIPGLPFVALGRNPWIAWGGTSLHAASSDLVMVPEETRPHLRERVEEIPVRWSRPRRINIRESRWGPVVSDLPAFAGGGATLALRWIGHGPSDESTAMLRLSRARNWREFQEALAGFGVPGQRMLYADTEGHVGHMIAAHLPRRPEARPGDIVSAPDQSIGWDAPVSGADLPAAFDPAEGFVASANERPEPGEILIGHHFSPPDRKQRMDALLGPLAGIDIAAARRIQGDVRWQEALVQRDRMLAWLDAMGGRPPERGERSLVAALRSWDGDYAADSEGALAFELLSCELAGRLVAARARQSYQASWGMRRLVWQDLLATPPGTRDRALRPALRAAARAFRRYGRWGAMHRLALAHPLGRLPLLGRRYRIADLPASGSSDTLSKTAHGLSSKRHTSRYGSTARHLSDLSDPDRNYFVLPGGQDGWLGSSTFADQVALWQRGEYMTVPLRPETAEALFLHRTDLLP